MKTTIKHLSVHLEKWLAGARDGDFVMLDDNKLTDLHPEFADRWVVFDYPLNKEVELDSYFSKVPTLEDFITFVAKSYKDVIYKNDDNIWGHDLGDLFLEGIKLRKDGKIELIMGS